MPISNNNQKKILLIEDDLIVQQVHFDILSRLGYIVDIAANGIQALNLLHNSYDIILIDIELPDISGIEIARIIRQDLYNLSIPLATLTTYSTLEIKKSCEAAGINYFMTKPVKPGLLKKILNKISSKRCTKRKEIIIAQSINLMYKKGYFGTSIHEIAKSSQIRKATLFDHFASKEILLKAIIKCAIEQWYEIIFIPYLQRNSQKTFREYQKAIHRFSTENKTLYLVFLLAQETVNVVSGINDLTRPFIRAWLKGLLKFPEVPNKKHAYYHLTKNIGKGVMKRVLEKHN